MIIKPLSEERLLAVAKTLPVAPQIMARLHTMLLDVNSGLDDVADLLRRDVSLTTRILRIANSAAYHGSALGTIEEAVQRVGFGEVFRLVGVAAIADVADARMPCYGYTGEAFSAHNLCTALVAEGIARKVKSDTRLAYTAGLLRCIGQILLDRIGRESLAPSQSFPDSGNGNLIEWERNVFGLAHFEVASLLLRHWGFPDAVVRAVAHDHSLDSRPTLLAQQLHLAEAIARFSGFGLYGEDVSWSIPHSALSALDMTLEEATAIGEKAIAGLTALQEA